jgi:hypothetical protein
MVHTIEESFDVCFRYMTHPLLLDGPPQLVQTPMLAATGSIPMTAVYEGFLIDRLQNPLYRQLHHLVLKTTDAKRAPLDASRLWCVGSPLGLWAISHTLQPVRQIPEVLFEVPPIVFLGYAIHTDGFVAVQCFVALPQVVHVCNVMIK